MSDQDCDCGRDHLKQILHPSLDPEIDIPVWRCGNCGDISKGW